MFFAILLLSRENSLLAHENHVHGSEANPLIEEMTALDSAFREVVSAVALGDGPKVHRALESMHGSREKTHEGIHAGSVKLPKNNQRLADFVKMDKQFHGKLEALAKAGQLNDQKQLLTLSKQLLDGCVQCHQVFRK